MTDFPELKINLEYERLLAKLPAKEYEALKESIKAMGQHFPIIVNDENVILDGHHRYRICKELGIAPKVEVKTFPNKLLEKKFVIEANLHRRHLNAFQKAELAYPLLEIERELAKLRQLAGVSIKSQETSSSSELKVSQDFGQARDIVAKAVGLSPTTFQRAVKIIEKAPEDLKEKVRQGKMSINYAYEMVKNRTERVETPKLPDGKFNVIYADPPWEYYLPLRGSPDMHYLTMSTEEICRLEIPADDNAVLFLWATNPKLEDALKVMKAWGFEYRTNMVWVKDKIGTGYYFRGQHELLLVGVKGNIGVPLEENRPPSVLTAPVREHSRKPDIVYEIIERMYPNGRYLELFARQQRPGWTAWGHA